MPAKKETKQVVRLIHILQMIPSHPRSISTSEIIDRLERDFSVGVPNARTVQRDLKELEAIFGVYVDDSSKPHKYSFRGGVEVDLKLMNQEMALGFAMMEKYLRDVLPETAHDHLSPYFRKAKSVLKGNKLRYSEWDRRVAIHPKVYPTKKAEFHPNHLLDIYNAILNQKAILIKYKKKNGDISEQLLHPQGVVVREEVSYLLATGGKDFQIFPSHYALHRIKEIDDTEIKNNELRDFNVEEYIDSGGLNIPLKEVKSKNIELIFEAASAKHLYKSPISNTQSIKELKNGRHKLEAKIEISHQLMWWILGFGDQVEVIKPIALRKIIAEKVSNLSKMYNI